MLTKPKHGITLEVTVYNYMLQHGMVSIKLFSVGEFRCVYVFEYSHEILHFNKDNNFNQKTLVFRLVVR